MSSIDDISFRDKMTGWRKFGFVVRYTSEQREDVKFGSTTDNHTKEFRESLHENIYMQGFLNNLFLRPSCYSCKVRSGRCESDITLGDFWGIWNVMPEIDDNRGVSLVLSNTSKGEQTLLSLKAKLFIVGYEEGLKYNHCIEHSVTETKWRQAFWDGYDSHKVEESINKILQRMQPSFTSCVIKKIKHTIKYIIK